MNDKKCIIYPHHEAYFDSISDGEYQQVVNFPFGEIQIDLVQDLKHEPEGLVVFLPSAQNRSHDPKVPYFPRWSWKDDFKDYDFLVISDPVLRIDPSIHSSWFLNNNVDILEQISLFVSLLVEKRPYSVNECTFYGSSMGGFAAISLASLLPGSKAVAEVPQIDMRRFPDRVALTQVDLMLGGKDSMALLESKAAERLNVINRVQKTGCLPPTLIITNRMDSGFSEQVDFVMSSQDTMQHLSYISQLSLYVDPVHSGHSVLDRSTATGLINQFASQPMKPMRVRRIEPSVGGLPLLEPNWVHDIRYPLTLNDSPKWFEYKFNYGESFCVDLAFKNSGEQQLKAAVLAFDIEGLTEDRLAELGIQVSAHKNLGYFKYLSLREGDNTINMEFHLNPMEKLCGVGILAWSSEDLILEKFDVLSSS